ncbi:MAG: FAD binding domain-containing protein [Treponema sp.]|nr:FAD binding domain-containing protein [Treponema sp.]
MADQANLIIYPSNYSELFNVWNRNPTAELLAGGTALIREQGKLALDLPPVILSLEKIEEMQRISRSERYIEIGAMVKLSQVLNLGTIVPAALRRCLEHIAGPQFRNMATLGGNLCFSGGCLDSAAALTALDAQFELRNAHFSRWISASRFFATQGTTALTPHELLARIRVPLDDWDYTACKKFAGQANLSKVVVFLAKTQKNILSDIRIVYKTNVLWRDKDSESMLIGKPLPLNQSAAAEFTGKWETFLNGIPNVDELSRKELINFIKINMYNLSE